MHEEQDGKVNLKVRVADAQGLRLCRGGEIRLVLTLCASDDTQGEAFGAKVTPWLAVPDNKAPQWRAREAVFSVPVDRCFEASFVDSAYLHVALMQKGHEPVDGNQKKAEGSATSALKGAALGSLSALRKGNLGAALGTAAQGLREGAAPLDRLLSVDPTESRGEIVGVLQMSVGRRMACSAQSMDEASWAPLLEPGQEGRVKGSLLLEISSLQQAMSSAPVAAPTAAAPTAAVAAAAVSPTVSPRGPSGSSCAQGYISDSASESGTASETASSAGFGSTASSAPPREATSTYQEPRLDPEVSLSSILSSKLLLDQLPSETSVEERQWAPLTRAGGSAPDLSEVNIFTINEPSSASSTGKAIREKLWKWSKTSQEAPRKISQRLRSAFDPGVREQRREVRKWRRWHEVFSVLNEIEQRLSLALSLLAQAASSMRRFGQSHGRDLLREASRLPAFLCDAALYYKSEAGVPERLEEQLAALERVADDFRGVSLEPSADASQSQECCEQQIDLQQPELRQQCEDLQVDVSVLLESLLMGAQQALAEYKKMHCRLELMAKEYEPLCRLELADASRPVTFLPLLADESAKAAAASLPEQAVQWAEAFSQLADTASKTLDCLVRELQSRKKHLRVCLEELRALLLRRAATGPSQE